jgi:hypothetical protein
MEGCDMTEITRVTNGKIIGTCELCGKHEIELYNYNAEFLCVHCIDAIVIYRIGEG